MNSYEVPALDKQSIQSLNHHSLTDFLASKLLKSTKSPYIVLSFINLVLKPVNWRTLILIDASII